MIQDWTRIQSETKMNAQAINYHETNPTYSETDLSSEQYSAYDINQF